MKLNLMCIKFHQKIKSSKNLNFGLFRFFSKSFSSPGPPKAEVTIRSHFSRTNAPRVDCSRTQCW